MDKLNISIGGGPNPYKVVIILEELGVPYTKVSRSSHPYVCLPGNALTDTEHQIVVENPKVEWFAAINPNGRVPAIEDPNTGVTLWESGAIVEYLVETYDKEGLLDIRDDVAAKWQIRQYLQFQMSGQVSFPSRWYLRSKSKPPWTLILDRARTMDKLCGFTGVPRTCPRQRTDISSRLPVSLVCWTIS